MQSPHPEDPPLLADAEAYRLFQNGLIWKDMSAFLEQRLSFITSDLMVAESVDEIRKLQGEAQSIQTLLSLPDRLLAEAEALELEKDG